MIVTLLGIEAIPLGRINGWLNYDIPVWWILIAVLLGVGVFLSIRSRCKDPAFVQITTGRYGDYNWTWTWKKTADGYAVTDLNLLCPRCGQVMYCGLYDRAHTCPANHQVPIQQVPSFAGIQKQIVHDFRTTYPKDKLQIIDKEEL